MVAQDPPNSLDAAWSAAKLTDQTEVLVGGDAPPDSCLGKLHGLLQLAPEEDVAPCPHLLADPRLPWHRFLERPEALLCARCVPPAYLVLLRLGRGVRMRCSCCGQVRWMAGPARLEYGQGTALGVLCAACLEEQAAGVVAVRAS
jgi:hypothetical protein